MKTPGGILNGNSSVSVISLISTLAAMFKFTPCAILTEEFHVVLKLSPNSPQPSWCRQVCTRTRTHNTGTSHSAALWVLSVHNMAAIILLAGSGGLGQEGEGEGGDKWRNEVRKWPPKKEGWEGSAGEGSGQQKEAMASVRRWKEARWKERIRKAGRHAGA